MSKDRKFDTIVENALHRFQRTEFLVGDLVKLVENWDRDDWVKRQSKGMIERVREIVEQGRHLRVAGIRGLYEDGSSGLGNQEAADYHYIEMVEELAPGRYSGFVTVPVHLVERVQIEGNNVTAPMPDGLVRKPNHHIKPEEVNIEHGDDMINPTHQTRCEHPAKEMPKQNVTLPGATAAKSYTAGYIN